jgi:hypothetical protein
MRHGGRVLVITMVCILAAAAVSAAPWPKVDEQTAGDVRYVNGGFGIEERESMPTGFPLKLVFATDRGNLLSKVAVSIRDGAGKSVFQVSAEDGPWLLVALKPGSYTVEATHNGHKKSASVDVPAKGTAMALLTWKTTEVDMGLPD